MTEMLHSWCEPDYGPEDLLLILNVDTIKPSSKHYPNAFEDLALVTWADRKNHEHLSCFKTNKQIYVVIKPADVWFFAGLELIHKFTFFGVLTTPSFSRTIPYRFPENTRIIERAIIAWDVLTSSSNLPKQSVLPSRKSQIESVPTHKL